MVSGARVALSEYAWVPGPVPFVRQGSEARVPADAPKMPFPR